LSALQILSPIYRLALAILLSSLGNDRKNARGKKLPTLVLGSPGGGGKVR
jgi:hypothetical protein